MTNVIQFYKKKTLLHRFELKDIKIKTKLKIPYQNFFKKYLIFYFSVMDIECLIT